MNLVSWKSLMGNLVRKSIFLATDRFARVNSDREKMTLKSVRNCLSAASTNKFIGELLQSDRPFAIARLGSTEFATIKRYKKMTQFSTLEKIADYSTTSEWSFSYTKSQRDSIACLSGFFPITTTALNRFAKLTIDSMSAVDLLGSWLSEEGLFDTELSAASVCDLVDLEPYFHQNPWSQFLAGKKVLVIHPFADSIQQQYDRHRDNLFQDPLILPKFELTTLRAVQSIAGNRPSEYPDWFVALDDMYQKAIAIDPDVVILGCGAYGFPLAAMLKNAGKQAIHLGGCTQILFGIKGERWDERPAFKALYNQYWTRPAEWERPMGAEKVEGGCYW